MPEPPERLEGPATWPDAPSRWRAAAIEFLRCGRPLAAIGERYGRSRERASQLVREACITTEERLWAVRTRPPRRRVRERRAGSVTEVGGGGGGEERFAIEWETSYDGGDSGQPYSMRIVRG